MKNTIDNQKGKKQKKSRMAVNNTASKKAYKQSRQNQPKSDKKETDKPITKVVITILIMLLAVVLVCVSGAFDITEIIVEENTTLSDEQIISFSGIEKGSNLFAISKREIRNKLKENSYINHVKIQRCLPNKIKLIVEERQCEYALQLANSYVYINRQGYVLEISNNQPQVPQILGFTTDLSNIKTNDRLDEADLNKMNMVIKIMETASKNDMKNFITKIDISNEENYTIYLDTEGKIAYLGNGSELNTRFLYIKKLLEIYQGKSGEILVNGDLNSEYVYFRENV